MINKDGCYHTKTTCKGEYCCFHNPSDHKMNTWPMTIRFDRGGLTERLCEHGIGHPDPDSLNWINRMAKDGERLGDSGVHGCDGCCMENFGETTLPILMPLAQDRPLVNPEEKCVCGHKKRGHGISKAVLDECLAYVGTAGWSHGRCPCRKFTSKEKFLPTWLSITLTLLAFSWLTCLIIALNH